ncbi:MAG: hypothetical protein ACFN4S_12050, partial [Prevotella conceptionensis]
TIVFNQKLESNSDEGFAWKVIPSILLKNRQNRLGRMRAFVQRHGKHVRLLPPARAVVGNAAHGQQGLHHGNADVIGHWQVVFNL